MKRRDKENRWMMAEAIFIGALVLLPFGQWLYGLLT